MKILLKLRYNGAAYCGFQSQADGRAIQNVLTESFSKLFGFPCSVTGCSRTDSGVHALGFCAAVAPRDCAPDDAWCSIPTGRIHRAANIRLPDDISVIAAAEVPDDFHPRYNVVAKEYEYRIYDSPARDPFLAGRAYHSPRRIPDDAVRIMQQAASLYVGRHDFSAYMASGSKITVPVRTVFDASVSRLGDGLLVYRVKADGFLYNMVRIMAGTLLECAWGSRMLADAEASVRLGNRRLAGFTAPPEGLYLKEVTYDREIRWLCE